MTKWMNKPISELHDALVRKTVTPLQLVQDCIDGVKADKGNCFRGDCLRPGSCRGGEDR